METLIIFLVWAAIAALPKETKDRLTEDKSDLFI